MTKAKADPLCVRCGSPKPNGKGRKLCESCRPVRWTGPPNYWNGWHRARRRHAIYLLGGCCVMCGEADLIVLQIDHIKPVGRVNGRRVESTQGAVKSVIDGKPGYQLLCANCHVRKTLANGEHLRP